MTTFLLPDLPIASFDAYMATESGGAGIRRALELGPAATIEEVLRSGLRGRGGGGFLTGRKWSGVVSQPGQRRYLVCNGAEGEPGTFKDRALMRAKRNAAKLPKLSSIAAARSPSGWSPPSGLRFVQYCEWST